MEDNFEELNREMSGAGVTAQGSAEKSEDSKLLGKGLEPDRNLDYVNGDSVFNSTHDSAMFARFEAADGAFASPWLPATDRQSHREQA